jgi:uncharacterized protein (TIGR03437 family)
MEELIPPTPAHDRPYGAQVPGSMNWIRGEGLDAAVAIRLNGIPVPILAQTAEEIVVQIPFEVEPGLTHFEFVWNAPLLFEPFPRPLEVESRRPDPIRFGEELMGFSSGGEVIATADFSSLVTSDAPAELGDVVHIYMTGLGAVSPPVPTGQPASIDRLHWLTAPLNCEYSSQDLPTTPLFAGLAPGMIGIYQLTVRLPNQHDPVGPGVSIGLDCGGGGVSIPVRRGSVAKAPVGSL